MSIMNRFIIWMYSKKRISFDIRFRCVPIGRTFFLHHFAYFLFQPPHNLFFQSGNIGLRNPQNIRHLLLRFFLCFRQNTKAHFYNPPLPSAQLLNGILQKLSVNLILNILRDDIVLRPHNIGKQQLISFPVHIQRLINGNLCFRLAVSSQIHQNFIFDTA